MATLAALAGLLWRIAHGQSGSDFTFVAASAAVGYIGALPWFRLRG